MKTEIKTVLLLYILIFICASCRKKDDNKPSNNNSTVTDIEGNVYHTVKIGTQVWMLENLKATHYNDGTAIPLVIDSMAWGKLTTPGYCWYNNDAAKYKNMYGALYNWYTVNTGKLAPTGWHVATDAEWATLQNYLIANGYNYDGSTSKNKFAKSLAATTNWTPDPESYSGTIGDDLSKNNRTGFSALPGGFRDGFGFSDAGDNGFWWSSTEISTFYSLISAVGAVFGIGSCESRTFLAWHRHLCYDRSDLYREAYLKIHGYSIRCVRDN
jgi:uncharacterized protein (TIGR02145 family)